MTVRLEAAFLDRVPEKIAEGGQTATHASGKIRFRLIGGWGGGGEQPEENTLRIKFSNFGMYRRGDNLMFLAYHEGDEKHAYTEQVAQIKFPVKNKEGQAQEITFPCPKEITKGTKRIVLGAVSTSGMPVEYYVKHGPATVDGNVLSFLPIPPRSKYPVEICVGAYQWGRSVDPKVKSAESVEVTFYLKE